jgi:DNA polymerase-3 subunit gamma/tau
VLADALRQLTGRAWRVELSNEDGQPSLRQQEQMAEDRARAAVLADPNVAAVLSAFPGAQLECVTAKEA